MIKSALIIKLSAIGDVVMALPMLESLRRQNPKVKISWMIGKAAAPLLEKLNLVDELIVVDENRLLAGNYLERLLVLLKIWRKLFGRQFDLVATGHADARYRLLSLTVFAENRHHFRRDKTRFHPIPGRHHSDEYVRLVTGEDGPDIQPAVLPIIDWELSSKLQQELPAGRGVPTVAFAAGGAKNVLHEDSIRRWPLESYVTLAGKLRENNISVILTGAPSDNWIVPAFAGLDVMDLVGKTNLPELVALYQRCDVVVTHDSGPLHLAGLAGTPLVALFGPTHPNEKVPRHEKSKIIWGGEKLACRPCYDGRFYADCRENVCLQSIMVDDVYDAVANIISNKYNNTTASSGSARTTEHKSGD